MSLTRRHFLEIVAGTLVVPGLARGRARRAETLRIGLLAPVMAPAGSAAASVVRGARLGAEEAERSAALFGGHVELMVDTSVERLLRDARPSVLLGGADEAECAHLVERTAGEDVLFINAGCTSDALRVACALHAFHVAPSEAMRRDALAMAPAGTPTGRAVASWHPSLEAFGAGQLNDRFRARYGDAMDARAWEAWMAVKIVAEAALRAGSARPVALGTYLVQPGTRFDGHKGRPLSFRAWDHQLRQPLYVVPAAGGRPVEVPDRAPGARVADQLDRLGTPEAAGACRWGAP
jgi:ABC-type branched-subunit amino acid transport system substrate-binding protein